LSEVRLLGRVSLSGLCNTFKNFPVPVSQLRSSVIHCRISIIQATSSSVGQHSWRGGSVVLSNQQTHPCLAPSLHYLMQAFSAAKAVCASACVG
jgi:hypothetical protein